MGIIIQIEFWGIVSDFAIAAVTIATAYFLYNALQTRKDAQKSQDASGQKSHGDFIIDGRPDLRYSPFEDIVSAQIGGGCVAIAVRNISIHTAMRVTPVFVNSDSISLELFDAVPKTLAAEDAALRLYFRFGLAANTDYDFHFNILFEDAAGRRYDQQVLCWKTDGVQQVVPSLSREKV